MYFLFAWHVGEQIGGAYDLVGTFKTLDAAIAKAERFLQGDWRFEVQVTDERMKIVFESNTHALDLEITEDLAS